MNMTIRELSKTYPSGKKALDRISLEIEDGMFDLLGPNGAGKTRVIIASASAMLLLWGLFNLQKRERFM